VLRLPEATAVFFFLAASADLTSLRRVGDTCNAEIDLIKAISSYLSMTPRQEPLLAHNRHSASE
jgi:hypothetical protein